MEHDIPCGSGSEEVRFQGDPSPDLASLLQFKVYRRRWFILLVLCLLNCSNAMLWLTFAPVADEFARVLDVSLDQINWLSLVYMIVAIPLSFVSTWMLDTWGLRLTLILGAWLNMLGSVLRFVGVLHVMAPPRRFPLVMAGQVVCAVAQPLVIFSPTKLAGVWFPQQQRATANMIASMSNPLGVLFANILSPLIAGSWFGDLSTLLLVYAVPATVVCFLATVGIRDSAPPTPPSASAETSNSEPFLQGIRLLLRNRAYLLLMICFGSAVAIFTCFSTLLEQILCVKEYTNNSALRSGDKALYSTARANLKRGIKDAKKAYKRKIEDHLTNNNPKRVWQGIHHQLQEEQHQYCPR